MKMVHLLRAVLVAGIVVCFLYAVSERGELSFLYWLFFLGIQLLPWAIFAACVRLSGQRKAAGLLTLCVGLLLIGLLVFAWIRPSFFFAASPFNFLFAPMYGVAVAGANLAALAAIRTFRRFRKTAD